MEFLKANYVNTTTGVTVESNTATVSFILDTNPIFQYVSENYNNDLTTTTITFSFDETLTVNRLAMLSTNLKGFTIYYDGVTANTFLMTTTSDTTTSDYSSNSATAKYLFFTGVDCTSVSIDMKTTQTADQEKAIGYIAISKQLMDFSRIPSARGYVPILKANNVVHRLSDGGHRIQTLGEKWQHSISYDYIPDTFRDSLRTTYDLHQEMIFAPFGTATSWDGVIYPCAWAGSFGFYRFSDNATEAGFSGSITILETPR